MFWVFVCVLCVVCVCVSECINISVMFRCVGLNKFNNGFLCSTGWSGLERVGAENENL